MKVTISQEALAAALRESTEFRGALDDTGKAVATEFERMARSEAYETGDYSRSMRVEVNDDASVTVVADDWKAGWIEFGYVGQRGHHVAPRAIVRRAAEAVGLRPLTEGDER